MDTSELEGLLQQAEQLTASISGNEDFPRLEKNLHQILQNSNQLWSKTAGGGSAAPGVKASVLMGSKGLDLPNLQQQLTSISDSNVLQRVETKEEVDLQSVLKSERQTLILSLINETNKRTLEDSQRRHWDSVLRQWDQEKQHVLTTLMGSQDLLVDLSVPTTAPTIAPSTAASHNMTKLEVLYARKVSLFNQKTVEGGLVPNLLDLFKEVGDLSGDSFSEELWHMAAAMVQPEGAPLHSLASGGDLQSDLLQCRHSDKAHNLIVKNSLRYLTQRFRRYMQSLVFENISDVSLGGVPSLLNLAKGYLGITLKSTSSQSGCEDGLVEGYPVWALLFVCLRAGDVGTAAEIARRAPQGIGDFISVMEEFSSSHGSLSHNTRVQLRLAYRRTVCRSTDPYKRAVYCVLAQCDVLENHSSVCSKVEDYIWLKLSQVHQSSYDVDLASTDCMSLPQLQSLLTKDYGEAHFQAQSQPFLYFQVLWLTGLFEDAVEFLSRNVHLRPHAVHLSLLLREERLLLQPEDTRSTQLLSLTVDEESGVTVKQLNFVRLITLYVKKFDKSDPGEALQYFFLLRDQSFDGNCSNMNATDDMFIYCVAELVSETRDFALLFGSRDSNDIRHPGILDKLDPANTPRMIAKVAQDSEKRGLFEDAVYLYDLAGDKEKHRAIDLLNRLLVPVIPTVSGSGSRDRIVQMATEIAERYRRKGYVGSQAAVKTFYHLLDLATFYDLYHQGLHDEALDVISKLQLVPLLQSPGHLEQLLDNFRGLSEEMKQCFPGILITTMKILTHKYNQTVGRGNSSLMNGSFSNTAGDSSKHNLRAKAQQLTTFAGRIPYRLPGDINTQLAQMELLMN